MPPEHCVRKGVRLASTLVILLGTVDSSERGIVVFRATTRSRGPRTVISVTDSYQDYPYHVTVAPQPTACEERKRLSEAYRDALHEVLALHMSEPDGLYAFRLKTARKKMDMARILYERHIAEHGCAAQ